MKSEIHPAVRRITWLMIMIGAGATLIAVVYLLFNLGPGVMLPFTKTALDSGWLAIFGLLWLVSGGLLLWWLRPGESSIAQNDQLPNTQLVEIEGQLARLGSRIDNLANNDALTTRLNSLEEAIQRLNTRIDDLAGMPDRLAKVEQRLNQPTPAVAASKQTPVNASDSRVLDHELDNMSTALQDANKRLDNLDDVANRVHELESQVDALYVTLHDAHQRIDGIEQGISG